VDSLPWVFVIEIEHFFTDDITVFEFYSYCNDPLSLGPIVIVESRSHPIEQADAGGCCKLPIMDSNLMCTPFHDIDYYS
jgi:hypothetical protein